MITVESVSKFYGSSAAVRDLDFTIEEGECVGFLGLNGAGKTTTLRMLSCLSLPTSGRITIRGLDVEESPHEIRKLIGYLPDRPPMYPEMRVAEFVRYAGRLRRMSKAEANARLPTVLETTGLTEVADQTIGTLSHGYKQRVGIAQAIVHKPALLILDEPIQGLDPVQIVEMRALIKSLRGDHTILLSSHILSEIERTCDRVLMLHDGCIVDEEERARARALHANGAHATATGPFVMELEVRGAEDAVRDALAGDVMRLLEVNSLGEGLVRVRLESEVDMREHAAKAIVAADLGLRGLRQDKTALEDAFVRLSQGESDADEGGAS